MTAVFRQQHAPGAVFGAQEITDFPQTVSPPLLTNTQTFYPATLTQGAPPPGGAQTISPPLLTNTQTFYPAVLTQTVPPDETSPVLSAPTGAAVGSAAGSGTITTNEGTGTLYWATTTNAAELEATVLAGLSQSVVAPGIQNTYTPGLTAETAYYHHFVHVDAAGNPSLVVSLTVPFTTAATPAAGQGSSKRMSFGLRIGL